MLQLREKGGRRYTRGWTGARWVKKTTNRHQRRSGKYALKYAHNGEYESPHPTRQYAGYVW